MSPQAIRFCAVVCFFLSLGSPARAVDVVISEFLASNTTGLTDEDGDDSDWIELSNVSGVAVNLAGWHLTDDAALLEKWTFPDQVLNVGEELVVFASSKDRAVSGGQLHTNFRLGAGGDYLALVRPDGVTIEYEFAPAYPQQYPDVSYGSGVLGAVTEQFIGPEDSVFFKVPSDASEDVGGGQPWNVLAFDDSAWSVGGLGVGFAVLANDPYDEFIGVGSDVQATLYPNNTTIYLRVPFEVVDPAAVTSLLLGVRYDDGFAAYINGSPVIASANLPSDGVLDFEALAGASHSDAEAVALQPFTVDLAGVNLVAGTNVLAVHGMNRSATNSDFLIDVELSGEVLASGGGVSLVYMAEPTPGADNSSGVPDLGPVIRDVTENPVRPDVATQSELLVTAEVTETQDAVASVTLFHRQSYDAEGSLAMLDDGVAPDVLAGDGIYSANVPLAGLAPGEMLRWRVVASDVDGTTSREPFFGDPVNSPEYFGTAALDPSVVSDLPVLEWFIQNPAGANSRIGSRASCLYLGEFYDNIFCRVRGNSSAGLNKKSYKFDFNTDHHFRFDLNPLIGRAEEFNLNTTWTDKAYVRQPLSYEIYDRAGAPGSVCFLTRVQQNGVFFSVAAYTEQVDRRLLKREARMDDRGALYKMYNTGTSGTSGVEKKNRTEEGNADLSAFLSGLQTSGAALDRFIFDNVDIPRQLNYLAAGVLTQNDDNSTKNYYLYRDSEGSGEWTQLPWDLDLTWGSHFMTGDNIAHDGIWATQDYVLGGSGMNTPISPSHPFVGIQELPPNRNWNRIADKLFESERFKDMFRRRLRTLMDDLLAAPLVEERLDAMVLELGNDAVLDRAKWGQFGAPQTLAQAIGILENSYLEPRRMHLFETHLASNAASYPTPQAFSALLPDAQMASPQVDFGSYDSSPASGDQDEEYIQLVNPNNFAVDLSDWKLLGGVEFTFLPGTILEANGVLYVVADVAAFRARASSPKGGEGLNVEGGFSGQLSSRGETVLLVDASLVEVAALTTVASPSAQQEFLRITELYYEPMGGGLFEFIEVTNIGLSELDLTGVYFSDGVTATLSGTLAPGEYGILVVDPANFPGLNVVGTYTGLLNNGGEQLTLRDSSGENILSFSYDGDWFPPASGGGYSIDLLDVNGDWSTWDLQSSWALSCEVGGSPGVANPEPHSMVYGAWSSLYFTTQELADPSISGADADASGDGVSNLIKYALGLDPKVATREGLPVVSVDGGYLNFEFTRLLKTADLVVMVEVSTDLKEWIAATSQVSFDDNLDGTATLVFRPNVAIALSPKQFLRLKVIQQFP